MKKKLLIGSIATAILLFSGCGVSSDEETSSSSVSGVVADGYIKNAVVCIDLNNNGECDSGEPAGVTGSNGEFSVSYEGNLSGQLIAKGGFDIERNTSITTMFTAPADNINITPLVSMAYAYAQENNVSFDTAVGDVASSLNVAPEDVTADPEKNSNIAPITLKIQSVVETLADTVAPDLSQAPEVSKDLYSELAVNLVNASGNTFDDKLSASIDALNVPAQAKDGAKTMISQINTLMQNGDLAKYGVIRNTVESYVKGLINQNLPFDPNALSDLINTALTVPADINLSTGDVNLTIGDINQTDLNVTDTNLSDINLTDINTTADTNVTTDLNATEVNVTASNIIETIQNSLSVLPVTAENLRNTASSKIASVNEAKYAVSKFRDAMNELFDPNVEDQEENTSTIVGSILYNGDTYLKPAVENVQNRLTQISEDISSSLDSFDQATSNDFKSVFMEISDRLKAISDVFDSHKENESFSNVTTSFGDDISYTYSEDNTTVTRVITVNNQTLTITAPKDNSREMLSGSEITTNGSITLSGNGYALNVTDLSYVNSHFTLKADANITGENSSNITGAMNYSFDLDQNEFNDANIASTIKNIDITINGTVFTGDQRLDGTFALSDTGLSLSGKYTDSAMNLELDGNFTLSLTDTYWKTYLDELGKVVEEDYDYMENTLIYINNELVVGASFDHDNNTVYLETADGNNYSCSGNDFYDMQCNDPVNFENLDGKIVEVNINGKTYYLDDVHFYWRDVDNGLDNFGIDFDTKLDDNKVEYFFDRGLVFIGDDNTEENVTALSFNVTEPTSSADNIYGSVQFSGSVRDSSSYANFDLAFVKDQNQTQYYINKAEISADSLTFSSNALAKVVVNSIDESIASAQLGEFNATVVDTNSNPAKITNATFAYLNENGVEKAGFFGQFSYMGTTLSGYIDSAVSDTEASGNMYVQIDKEGFEPLIIEATGSGDSNSSKTTLYVTQGDYKVGGYIVSAGEDVNASLFDSNGVFTDFSISEYANTLTLKDVTGNTLGTIDTSVNNWEIKYSDGSTETLY